MRGAAAAAVLLVGAAAGAAPRVEMHHDERGFKLVVVGRDFLVRGMNYGHTPIGQNYSWSLWNQPDAVVEEALNRDMKLLKQLVNPFSGGPPSEKTKWDIQTHAPPPAAFYSWATVLVWAPTGESQFYVGLNLQQMFQAKQADAADLPVMRDMAIRARQAVLDHFPGSASWDASGTFSFDLATPAYNGIVALGGMVQGGWILVKTADGRERAVRTGM
jgi:hypothetical protein